MTITKLNISTTTEFEKNLKKIKKQNKNIKKLLSVVNKIANHETLDEKYRDHLLVGYKIPGCRECHIEPDWLLVYRIYKNELLLLLVATGSHSNLFK